MDEEKDKLTQKLSEQYSRNIINLEEYERILERINKIETKKEAVIVERIIRIQEYINILATKKEAVIVEKIIQESSADQNELTVIQNDDTAISGTNREHLSMFSWRTTNVEPVNGRGGKFISLFGANRIIVNSLPKGRTILDVTSIFGLTEIIVAKNIKITNRTTAVFAGIFAPHSGDREEEGLPELYITGSAVFGNITIRKMDSTTPPFRPEY
jgi:hypothetical protein